MIKKSEILKTNYIESLLKEKGYTTLREVIPIECEKWERPYRVDLIFYKNPDEAVAVEFKDASLRSGGKIAEAYLQIEKYRKLKYKDLKIIEWCIFPSFYTPDEETHGNGESMLIVHDFVEYFFRKLNISYMWEHKKELYINNVCRGAL